jgi:hypothetical protein
MPDNVRNQIAIAAGVASLDPRALNDAQRASASFSCLWSDFALDVLIEPSMEEVLKAA